MVATHRYFCHLIGKYHWQQLNHFKCRPFLKDFSFGYGWYIASIKQLNSLNECITKKAEGIFLRCVSFLKGKFNKENCKRGRERCRVKLNCELMIFGTTTACTPPKCLILYWSKRYAIVSKIKSCIKIHTIIFDGAQLRNSFRLSHFIRSFARVKRQQEKKPNLLAFGVIWWTLKVCIYECIVAKPAANRVQCNHQLWDIYCIT